MDNTAKLKAGHPQKFFHPVAGLVDGANIKAHQAKVLEAEGRLAKSVPAAKKDKE